MSNDKTSEAEVARGNAENQQEYRERVIRLVFGGDPDAYGKFVGELRQATPDGVEVILRGSAVTGHKWGSDEPFDADGPGTSDLDVTFVGGDMVMLYRDFHIPGIHSAPLSDEHPFASPSMGPLRDRLCEMTGRAVNIQATTEIVQGVRNIFMNQPYLVLVEKQGESEKRDE